MFCASHAIIRKAPRAGRARPNSRVSRRRLRTNLFAGDGPCAHPGVFPSDLIVHLPKLAELLDRLSVRFELLDEAAEVHPRVVDPADDLDAPTRVTFLRDSLRGCFFVGTVRTRGGGATRTRAAARDATRSTIAAMSWTRTPRTTAARAKTIVAITGHAPRIRTIAATGSAVAAQ